MNAPASEIVRSKEPVFGSLALEGAREAELVAALSEHPVLLNRPIVAVTAKGETVARLCRPPELVKTLLAGVE